ncbi:MAG: DUF642 domain-containing protein [Inhella sp.]|jgi:hypothetical protein|uniref:DUF642 domain-containing protein n=1 Tax=Inhella sp. TaxID=1921806 RepID=UPI0022C37155|nr:DUF642 domain-containing protein [Inhella sp.]MCZ8235368.1 DUF642 domain-containing protein [Inhella sp.]
MNQLTRLSAAAALLVAGTANAAVIFSDNFDSNALGLNATPAGWTLTSGWVDIIGTGYFDFLPGNGKYIDMDGSRSQAGTLSRNLNLVAGTSYLLTFDLAGNWRNAAKEQVNVSFGSTTGSYSLGQKVGFTNFSLSFTPTISGAYGLSFAGTGGDNMGMLLDNVKVAAIPEPQTYALLALGLVLGATMRRRQR